MSDTRVKRWHLALKLIASTNLIAWCAAFVFAQPHDDFTRRQLVLSGLYVVGSAWRSFFPVVYVKRFTLTDDWRSSVFLGRAVATVAEIAFGVLLQGLTAVWAERTGLAWVSTAGWVTAALFTTAQLCCWFGVSTGRYLGELVEESLWTVGFAVLFVAALGVTLHLGAWPGIGVALGLIGSGGFVAFMLIHNLPMYVTRIRASRGAPTRSIPEGLRDMANRRHVSFEWADWAGEAAWLTPYFSVGVWLSIAVVFARSL